MKSHKRLICARKVYVRVATFVHTVHTERMICCFQSAAQKLKPFEGHLPAPLDVPLYEGEQILLMRGDPDHAELMPTSLSTEALSPLWTEISEKSSEHDAEPQGADGAN